MQAHGQSIQVKTKTPQRSESCYYNESFLRAWKDGLGPLSQVLSVALGNGSGYELRGWAAAGPPLPSFESASCVCPEQAFDVNAHCV